MPSDACGPEVPPKGLSRGSDKSTLGRDDPSRGETFVFQLGSNVEVRDVVRSFILLTTPLTTPIPRRKIIHNALPRLPWMPNNLLGGDGGSTSNRSARCIALFVASALCRSASERSSRATALNGGGVVAVELHFPAISRRSLISEDCCFGYVRSIRAVTNAAKAR